MTLELLAERLESLAVVALGPEEMQVGASMWGCWVVRVLGGGGAGIVR
jgi:hypothetical protein